MKAQKQENKTNGMRKSQLLLIGSFLIFFGVVSLFWSHLSQLREELFEEVRLKMFDDDSKGTSEEIKTSDVENINTEENQPAQEEQAQQPTFHYNYIGYLEIPRISLKRGFVEKGSKYNNINYNVTIADMSDYPDKKNGNFILMAHSGDAYISFFAYLYRLEIGDIAKVSYKGEQYKYQLTKIEEQPKQGYVAIHRDNYKTKALTLITCTKDNDSTQTIYIFELV